MVAATGGWRANKGYSVRGRLHRGLSTRGGGRVFMGVTKYVVITVGRTLPSGDGRTMSDRN